MRNNPTVPINGLPLETAVMSEFASVNDFIDRSVIKVNEEASLLVLVLAPAILRIGVDIALFDSNSQVPCPSLSFSSTSSASRTTLPATLSRRGWATV